MDKQIEKISSVNILPFLKILFDVCLVYDSLILRRRQRVRCAGGWGLKKVKSLTANQQCGNGDAPAVDGVGNKPFAA